MSRRNIIPREGLRKSVKQRKRRKEREEEKERTNRPMATLFRLSNALANGGFAVRSADLERGRSLEREVRLKRKIRDCSCCKDANWASCAWARRARKNPHPFCACGIR